jgi:NADH-quinone oxidoreductase subunit N
MAIYLVMTLGTFAAILLHAPRERAGRGHFRARRPRPAGPRGMAFLLAMLMFSLAGVPPLAGFFAKWYVFAPAVEAGLYGLAVVGVLLSVVSAYYYLRIVKIIYFDEPAAPFKGESPAAAWVMLAAGLLIVLFTVYPGPLDAAAAAAAKSLVAAGH